MTRLQRAQQTDIGQDQAVNTVRHHPVNIIKQHRQLRISVKRCIQGQGEGCSSRVGQLDDFGKLVFRRNLGPAEGPLVQGRRQAVVVPLRRQVAAVKLIGAGCQQLRGLLKIVDR